MDRLAPLTGTMNQITGFINQFGFVDVLVICLLIFGILRGIYQGASKLLFRLLQLVLMVMITLEYSGAVADFAGSHTPIVNMLIHVFIFLVFTLTFYFLTKWIIDFIVKILKLQFVDIIEKVGGIVLGAAFWALLLSFTTHFLLLFPGQWLRDTLEKKTLAGPYLIKTAPMVHQYTRQIIPMEWRAHR